KMHQDMDAPPRPWVLRLDRGGCDAWTEFTRAHAGGGNAEDFPDSLRGAWSKFKGHCARLTLVLHALHSAAEGVAPTSVQVSGDTLNQAAELVGYFKAHCRRVNACSDRDPVLGQAKLLLRWVWREKRSRFKRHEAHKDLVSEKAFPK